MPFKDAFVEWMEIIGPLLKGQRGYKVLRSCGGFVFFFSRAFIMCRVRVCVPGRFLCFWPPTSGTLFCPVACIGSDVVEEFRCLTVSQFLSSRR